MIDLKERIFRRRANENQPPVLHIGQEHILLTLIKAVDFVDKYNRALLVKFPRVIRFFDNLPDIANPRRHRIEFLEFTAGHAGNHLRQRSLAGTGRAIENHGGYLVFFHHLPQETAAAHSLLLSYEFIEITRPHALCQGRKPRSTATASTALVLRGRRK